MVDPVFVDTSEGRAIVADSLNPSQNVESSKMKIKSAETLSQKKEKLIKPQPEEDTKKAVLDTDSTGKERDGMS